ncbi:MAG: C40 family peptidase [Bacteroidota bacterium]
MANNRLTGKCLIFLMVIASGCALHRGISGSKSAPHTGTHSAKRAEQKLRTDITLYAKKHVGARYRYGGKSPTGFDCSGFTSFVMNRFDVPVSGPSYSQENLGKKINKDDAQPGDLVFFRKRKGGKVFHVAIVYEHDREGISLIHSTSSRGVVIDHLEKSSYWRTKVITVRDVVSGR